jgi:hypothetical protein
MVFDHNLIRMTFTVVTISGEKKTIALDPLMTIRDVKEKIEIEDGIEASTITLMADGQPCPDDSTLGDLGIEDGSNMHLILGDLLG